MPSLEELIATIPHRPADDVLSHPLLSEARRVYVDAIMRLYDSDPAQNRLILEAGRLMVFAIAVCLHARYDEADRDTWPTVGKLKEMLGVFQVASSRQIDDVITRLIDQDYLYLVPPPGDHRVRLIVPTETLYAHHRALIAAFYAPLHFMFPDPGYALAVNHDPAFHKVHAAVCVATMAWSAKIVAGNPPMLFFLSHHAGMVILMKLIQMMDNTGMTKGLSYTGIGLRFGVSRTHVKNLMRDAEALGLIRLSGRGGHQVELLPPLIEAFDRLFADAAPIHDLTYCLALKEIEIARAA